MKKQGRRNGGPTNGKGLPLRSPELLAFEQAWYGNLYMLFDEWSAELMKDPEVRDAIRNLHNVYARKAAQHLSSKSRK